MENENIKRIEKKLEEIAEEAKNLGLSSPEEDLPLKIMRIIQKVLDENGLDIVMTPMMYNSEDFMPILGVLTKEESGALRLKYKISIVDNSPSQDELK